MRTLHLAILLLFVDTGQAFLYTSGILLPHDPHIQDGSPLVLNCTITSGNYNSSQVYFEVKKTRISSNYIHIIDNKTAQLRMPNMSAEDPIQTYICKWPDSSVKMFPSQKVQVSYPPGEPQNVSCINYNWESMTCTFSPGKQDPRLPTEFLVFYTIDLIGLYHCPVPSLYGCTWNKRDGRDSFQDHKTYHLRICANSSINETCIWTSVHTKNIVKPNKVRSLTGQVLSSTSVNLSWKSPSKFSIHKVLYSVTVKNIPNISYNTREINLRIDSLRPNTQYRFAVRSKPVRKGFWSDEAYIDLKTNTDVPAALPPVTKHGFQLSSQRRKPNHIHASIYWQNLESVLVNGPLRGYTITKKIFDDGKSTDSKVHRIEQAFVHPERKLLMAEFELRTGSLYKFSVAAESDKGYNESLSEKPVIITPYRTVKPPDKVVALHLKETEVLVNWTLVPGAVEYMLFWCYSKLPGTCDKNVSWQKYNKDEHQAVLTLGNGAFIFAVSVQLANGSVSGMSSWTRCTYIYETASAPPLEVRVSDYQEGESLTIEWTTFVCIQHLYVMHYIISICPSENRECNGETKNVTVDGSLGEYEIQDLVADQEYTAWMYTVAPSGISKHSAIVYGVVNFSGMRNATIAGIAVGAVIGCILLAVSIYAPYRKIRKIMSPGSIKIILPARINTSQITALNMEGEEMDEDDLSELATPNSMTELILSPLHGQRYKNPGIQNMCHFQQNGIFQKSRSSMSSTLDSLSSTNTMLSRLDGETESEDDSVFISEQMGRGSVPDRTLLQTVPEEQSTPRQERKKSSPTQTTMPNSSEEEYHKFAINDLRQNLFQPDDDKEGAASFSHRIYQQDLIAEDDLPCSYALIQGESQSGTPPCTLNLNNSNTYLEIIPDSTSSTESLDVKDTNKTCQGLSIESNDGDKNHHKKIPENKPVGTSDNPCNLCNYSKFAVGTHSLNETDFSKALSQDETFPDKEKADRYFLTYIEVFDDSGEGFDLGLVKPSQCENISSQVDIRTLNGCSDAARELSDNMSSQNDSVTVASTAPILQQTCEHSIDRAPMTNIIAEATSGVSVKTKANGYVCLSEVLDERDDMEQKQETNTFCT